MIHMKAAVRKGGRREIQRICMKQIQYRKKMPEWGDGKYKMPEQTGETENYGETVVLSAGQTEALPVL